MEKKELWKGMMVSGFMGQFQDLMEDLDINWSGGWRLDDILVRG